MEKNNSGNWKLAIILGTISLIVVLVIFLPGLIESKNELENSRHEGKLLSEGKYTSDIETLEDFIKSLENGDIESAKKLLSKDCMIYDENNNICTFEEYVSKIDTSTYYKYEKRGNSIDDEKTYRISWKDGLQIQTIVLDKVVNENEMHYEIVKCLLNIN